MEEALKNLAQLFPSFDKVFLEDVYVSCNKDFDKTVDQLLSMGVEFEVDKKPQQKPPQQQQQVLSPQPRPTPHPQQQQPQQQQQQQLQQQQQQQQPPSYTQQPSSQQQPTPSYHPHPPGSPSYHHAPVLSPTIAPTLTPTPSSLTPTLAPTHPTPPVSYPSRLDMYTTTPHPIMSNSGISAPAPNPTPTPTAPPATGALSSSQVDQKRLETMKQELALEYQRINDKHKYNLELQQKLEQLSEFTTAEQRKLEEQRAAFAEEKKRFTEDLTSKFKILQEDYARQKDELMKNEELRLSTIEAQTEAERIAKAERKAEKSALKFQQKEDAYKLEQERQAELEELRTVLKRAQDKHEMEMEAKAAVTQDLVADYVAQIEALSTQVATLSKQLKTAQYEASGEVLSYFSSVVSSLADGIHKVYIDRANSADVENGEDGNSSQLGDPLKDLKKTFFRTMNDSLNNKLKELE